MLGSAAVIAFVPSTDLARARRFYGDLLGLAVTEENPFACVFTTAGGVMLRVTKVEDLTPQPFTVLGWDVPDIHATAAALAAGGVRFHRYDGMDQDEHGVWVAPGGGRVAWFADPDGNVVSLTQFTA